MRRFLHILGKICLAVISIVTVWPALCWIASRVQGWHLYQTYYRPPVQPGQILTASVELKKFASYNNVIKIGIESYGLVFQPYWFVFYHRAFVIPWADILSFEYTFGRVVSTCNLHTRYGEVRIGGQGAQIAKIGCETHFVQVTS